MHWSYPEIMDIVDSFSKNTEDDQFENLIMSDMQLQDLEGGMKEGDSGFWDGPGPEVGAAGDF